MKKLICVIVVILFQIVSINAQFTDTLTIIEIENENPTSYSIAFVRRGADYFYKSGKKDQKVLYSEIKNGMTRYIIKEEDGEYTVHLINNAGKGYYQYFPMVGLDSLSYAKSYTPDLKLFSYGFTGTGLTAYLKIPGLDTLTKTEARNFLAYQHNTFSALKNFCDYIVKNSSFKVNYKTSKELYTVLRDRFQVQANINWLTSNGYSVASYVAFIYELIGLFDQDLMDKADEYAKKEEAFYQ